MHCVNLCVVWCVLCLSHGRFVHLVCAPCRYIEMMCASPRSDNAAARSILKPEAAATDEEKREVLS